MKIELQAQFKDDRGEIIDLLINESIDAITHITFTKGATRANHYHKETTQWTYVSSGSVIYASKKEGEKIVEEELQKGDFVVSLPNESHAFKALESSEILVFTKGPRAGFDYESDTYRLKDPLIT